MTKTKTKTKFHSEQGRLVASVWTAAAIAVGPLVPIAQGDDHGNNERIPHTINEHSTNESPDAGADIGLEHPLATLEAVWREVWERPFVAYGAGMLLEDSVLEGRWLVREVNIAGDAQTGIWTELDRMFLTIHEDPDITSTAHLATGLLRGPTHIERPLTCYVLTFAFDVEEEEREYHVLVPVDLRAVEQFDGGEILGGGILDGDPECTDIFGDPVLDCAQKFANCLTCASNRLNEDLGGCTRRTLGVLGGIIVGCAGLGALCGPAWIACAAGCAGIVGTGYAAVGHPHCGRGAWSQYKGRRRACTTAARNCGLIILEEWLEW